MRFLMPPSAIQFWSFSSAFHRWSWAVGLLASSYTAVAAIAADQPQWGQRFSRNMVSQEKGLPDHFDPKTGKNIRWTAPLGTQCYATPVVSSGKVLIGTNNGNPRDDKHVGDRGVLLCLNEADGSLAWQLVAPKLAEDIYLDWPEAGMCSPPTVEGDRVYLMTNRTEVVCLDLHGMANGNDGPYRNEGRYMSPPEDPPLEPGPTDADILWLLDLKTAAGVHPHDSSHSGILLDGPYLYVNTSNGVNNKHNGVAAPEAPALVVVDKSTGRLVAREREGISRRLVHGTWSSPALGEASEKKLVFFGGPDGVCYAFDAFPWPKPADASTEPGQTNQAASVDSLHCVWHFDCDPTSPKTDIHRYMGNRQESPSNIKSMVVFDNGRLYVAAGGDIWWGKKQAWLKCIDAAKTGDTTESAAIWSYPMTHHCVSTPSIHEGLIYVADCSGKVHCVDAETGQPCWVHDAHGEIWASTLVADGKIYIGTRKGDFWILATGRERRVLSSVRLDDPVISTAVAANGVLYVGTMTRLYAVQETTAISP
jgi:outer membrane protein assembly factor BamB